jgi:hypothetical protein
MESDTRKKFIYAVFIGCVYLLFGMVQFLMSMGAEISIMGPLRFDDNIFGGLIMVLIGAVFLFAMERLKWDENEGTAFLFSGIFLSLLFAGINLLILCSRLLTALLEGGQLDLLSGINPIIYLGSLTLIGLYVWRENFSLNRLSRAGA